MAKIIFKEKEQPVKTYKCGDWFVNQHGNLAVLAQVFPNEVVLMHIGEDEANRWKETIKVKNGLSITQEEFNQIGGGEEYTWTPVNVTITVE